MKEFFTMDDFDFTGKPVLVRVDVNSPMDPTTGRILNDARIRCHIPTLKDLRRSKVVILAHQSRPGKADFSTTKPHARRMSYLLRKRVRYVDGLYNGTAVRSIESIGEGEVLLLENVRFYSEEIVMKGKPVEKQAETLMVRTLAPMFDYFVQDAFACAHRSQPSTVGFASVLPTVAGRVMEREITMLDRLLHSDEKPKVAILGGLKVDDSINIIGHFLSNDIVSEVLTAGAVGTVYLMAKGVDVGAESKEIVDREVDNLYEEIEKAENQLDEFGDRILTPTDVVVNAKGKRVGMRIDKLPSDYPIFDIGLDTIVEYSLHIKKAAAAILNGPPGVFEIGDFSIGTREIFYALANSNAFSVIGGGHTIAAAESLGIVDRFDHVSTGGGALVSYLCGEELPAIKELKASYQRHSTQPS